MNGTSDITFSPEVTNDRAMIVTVLHRLENSPEASPSTFSDVEAGQWYTDAISWGEENKIVVGYGDGNFGPLDTVTREQLVTILYRYSEYKGNDMSSRSDLSSFSDAGQISDYAVDAMSWAYAEGLLTGASDTSLNPQGFATRAEVATILMRFCAQ